MKLTRNKFLIALSAALLAACGGTETIEGAMFYDPSEKSLAETTAEVQSGRFCNGLPLVSIASQAVPQPNGQNKLTFVCSNAQ